MPNSLAARLTDTGFVGVGFFFALSGFILMWTYNPELPVRYFYGRRVARLIPLHYGTALVAVIFIVVVSRPLPVAPVIANLTLLQAWVPADEFASSLNPVSWSLSCEAFFYLCFPYVARVIERVNRAVVAAAIALFLIVAAVMAMTFLPDVAVHLLYENPMYRIGGFVMGMLLATAMKQGFRSPIGLPWALVLSAAAYAIAFKSIPIAMSWGWAPGRVYGDLIFLPFALGLIAAAATSDLNGTHRWLRNRVLVKLGEASFALYLIHYLILQMYAASFGVLTGGLTAYLIIAVLGVSIVVLSVAVFQFYEKPAESALRLRLGTPPVTISELPRSRTDNVRRR
jgi:peptidoglycan/LPS O-acetylase OafA/YrhL